MTTTEMLPEAILENLEEFLSLISGHVGKIHAAIAVGWSPKQLREMERNPQFQEAMAMAKDMGLESIESKAYELAMAGNVPMIQMILYCHGADKGWRPPTQRVAVNHQGTIAVERVHAVTSAARELMREHGATSLAYGALEGDDEIVDAEVVDGAA